MALPAVFYGAVIGHIVYAGCEWLDERREKRKASLRRAYESREQKKVARSSQDCHCHRQLSDTDTKYLGNRAHWRESRGNWNDDSDSEDDIEPYEQGRLLQRRDSYMLDYHSPRYAGLLESSHSRIPQRKALLAAPMSAGSNVGSPTHREAVGQPTSPTLSPPPSQPFPASSPSHDPTPATSSRQRPRTHPRRSYTGRTVPLREITSMTYKELLDLLQDPTLSQDCRKVIRQRITQWEMVYYCYYQQQQQNMQRGGAQHQD